MSRTRMSSRAPTAASPRIAADTGVHELGSSGGQAGSMCVVAGRPGGYMTPVLPGMLVRWRTFLRFRSAFRRVAADSAFTYRLTQWQRFTRDFAFDLVLGEPLGESELHGTYEGLPVRIRLHMDEICRVHTHFWVTLPRAPRQELLQALESHGSLHERSTRLLGELDASRPSVAPGGYRTSAAPMNPSEAQKTLAYCELGASAERLSCSSRYVDKASEYGEILGALHALAHAISSPERSVTAEARVPD